MSSPTVDLTKPGTRSTMLALLQSTTAAWALRGDDPLVASKARGLLRGVLRGLPEEVTNDAIYAANEIVTNAVKYTRSKWEGGLLAMAVTIAASTVTVAVLDEGPLDGHLPVLSPADRHDSGWGLSSCEELGELRISPVPGAGHLVSVALNVEETPAPRHRLAEVSDPTKVFVICDLKETADATHAEFHNGARHPEVTR